MKLSSVSRSTAAPGAWLLLFAALLLLQTAPASAVKPRWFDNPVERRAEQPKSDQRAVERERFPDPPRARHSMFGAEAERNLQAAIRHYEQIVASGGWPKVAEGPGLGPGSLDPRVEALRARLMVTGDLPRAVGLGRKFTKDVTAAVKRFQRRHGLKPTGRVYGSTLDALNLPAEARLAQLRLNLDRVRKLASQLKGDRFIVVNIPAYELQAVANGRVELYSRVITGKPSTPTPILTANIQALDFRPYWHVPQSIASRALIPREAAEPGYLQSENIRVFSASAQGAAIDPGKVNWSQARGYVFRQDPGPFNALGVIRLDMPNKHTVYMHDTPLQRLFRYSVRSYSAGCVRVHRIFDLSAWLLQGVGGWNEARIQRAVAAGETESVTLPRPVPVYLVYVTAWGSQEETAQFRPDIYSQDGASRFVAELEGSKAEISAVTP